MLPDYLAQLLDRELGKLMDEINAYPDDAAVWKTTTGISNSGGNLALHLAGNLQHFIGTVLGNTGYVRNREEEFSAKNLTRAEVCERIAAARAMLPGVLAGLTDDDMQKIYPVRLLERDWPTGLFLMHLVSHFSYHLGQINYHRRLVA